MVGDERTGGGGGGGAVPARAAAASAGCGRVLHAGGDEVQPTIAQPPLSLQHSSWWAAWQVGQSESGAPSLNAKRQ
jgi:hypothetical protein